MIFRAGKYLTLTNILTTRMVAIILAAIILTACFPNSARLGQDKVLDITWEELKPSTSSQYRGNWEMIDVSRVYGREVVSEFSGLMVSNCPGPIPPENGAIRASSEYWFVRVVPRMLLSPTRKSPDSSTPGSIAPEPLFREARLLIDPFNGQVIARKFDCFQE